jgi:superfamily II DNA or RNA helicase
MIGEGLDVPGLASVSLCRPTKSLTIYMQQAGRCNRGGEGIARVMDHVQNHAIHGLPDDDREWTLEGRVKRRAAPGTLSIWSCPACWVCNRSTLPTCAGCGAPKPRDVVRMEEQAAELEVISRADVSDIHEVCTTAEDYVRFAAAKKKSGQWAAYQFWLRDNRARSDNAFLAAAGQVQPTMRQYLSAAEACGLHSHTARVYAAAIGLRR